MLNIRNYIILLFTFLTHQLFAGELTAKEGVQNLQLELHAIPKKEVNAHIESYAKKHREDFFTTKKNYIEFLSSLEDLLIVGGENYPQVTYYLGKELQRYSEFQLAYPYIYKTALYVEDNPTLHQIPCDFYEVLGISYFFFGRYSEAETTFNKGLACDGISDASKINIYNTIGLIYSNLNQSEEAISNFKKAMDIAKKINNAAWYGVLSGNIGNILFLEGDIEKAYEYIEIDYVSSMEHSQLGSAMNALSLLARIQVTKGNYAKAIELLSIHDSLQEFHKGKGSYLEYYETKTKLYEETGDYKKAFENYKLYREYNDSITKSKDLLTIKNTEFQINFEKKQSEIQLLHETQKTDRVRIISLWILTSTIILASAILIWQIMKRRKKEKELMQLKNQQMEEDLNRLESEMNQVLNNLILKNERINELNEEINSVQSRSEKKEEMKALTDKLQSFTFLTDEDWVEFKRLFEKRHRGFFDYFQENYPHVTNAEIRLAALIKLKLEKLEMSKALGISPESVSKTNLRLRKKLNIKDQKELQALILSI
ncbi:Tetratricopeptide repeat-containing protein [Lishizhenia tianjinensis]|uniref:Tetratricopeptide repeat-containing protein n=1 Tax=Lishizhenia tianjinensis TaxID=477690 RepID=A0A1I6YW14_9FLAO|nr:tetratricopeptide repeat protein [Lishizhenia tianjinensis]SFT54488.1 Tetratricopeptide repeat-containing protein [Lishizhenia tianjinensis]